MCCRSPGNRIALIVILAAFCGCASASRHDRPDETVPRVARTPESDCFRMNWSLIPTPFQRHLCVAGVCLGCDSIGSVVGRLGSVTPCREDSAGESRAVVLEYLSTLSPRPVRVIFECGPQGGWVDVDEYRVEVLADTSERICSSRGRLRDPRGIRTPGGLRLGLKRAEVERVCGKPMEARGETLLYRYEGDWAKDPNGRWVAAEGRKAGSWHIWVEMDVVVRADGVTGFAVRSFSDR